MNGTRQVSAHSRLPTMRRKAPPSTSTRSNKLRRSADAPRSPQRARLLHFARRSHYVEVRADGVEVAASAADFFGFAVAKLLEVLRALCFAPQVKHGVIVLENRP